MHFHEAVDTSHPLPRPRTVLLGDIERDPSVASIPLRKDHIDKLTEDFKPWLVGMPIVSLREDGTIAVLNGSHRCEMLRQLFGDLIELDVLAFRGLTIEQEVEIFQHHHRKFLAVKDGKKGKKK